MPILTVKQEQPEQILILLFNSTFVHLDFS